MDILGMFRGLHSNEYQNPSMNLHKMWCCLLLTLDLYNYEHCSVQLYLSFIIFDTLRSTFHYLFAAYPFKLKQEVPQFCLLLYTQENRVSTKNLLRMFEAYFWKNIRMLSRDEKIHHSYTCHAWGVCWMISSFVAMERGTKRGG